jgi:hypothetical protein
MHFRVGHYENGRTQLSSGWVFFFEGCFCHGKIKKGGETEHPSLVSSGTFTVHNSF